MTCHCVSYSSFVIRVTHVDTRTNTSVIHHERNDGSTETDGEPNIRRAFVGVLCCLVLFEIHNIDSSTVSQDTVVLSLQISDGNVVLLTGCFSCSFLASDGNNTRHEPKTDSRRTQRMSPIDEL
jgi:hypothetical protein